MVERSGIRWVLCQDRSIEFLEQTFDNQRDGGVIMKRFWLLEFVVVFLWSLSAQAGDDPHFSCYAGLQKNLSCGGYGRVSWIGDYKASDPSTLEGIVRAGVNARRPGYYLYRPDGIYFFQVPQSVLKTRIGEERFWVKTHESGWRSDFIITCNLALKDTPYFCSKSPSGNVRKDLGISMGWSPYRAWRQQDKYSVTGLDSIGSEEASAAIVPLLENCATGLFSSEKRPPALAGELELDYLSRIGLASCSRLDGKEFWNKVKSNLGVAQLVPAETSPRQSSGSSGARSAGP
jgi:hypothetical protein